MFQRHPPSRRHRGWGTGDGGVSTAGASRYLQQKGLRLGLAVTLFYYPVKCQPRLTLQIPSLLQVSSQIGCKLYQSRVQKVSNHISTLFFRSLVNICLVCLKLKHPQTYHQRGLEGPPEERRSVIATRWPLYIAEMLISPVSNFIFV